MVVPSIPDGKFSFNRCATGPGIKNFSLTWSSVLKQYNCSSFFNSGFQFETIRTVVPCGDLDANKPRRGTAYKFEFSVNHWIETNTRRS